MKSIRSDFVAGLSTAAVAMPRAMGVAAIAGLSVEAGLYTAIFASLAYAAAGTSRCLSVTTTSTIAILVAQAAAQRAPGDSAQLVVVASALALAVGGVLLLASVLRLGFLADFISAPVLTGFKGGIAVVVVVAQLPKLLGIPPTGGDFSQKVAGLVRHLPDTSAATVMIGLGLLGVIVALQRFLPRWPAPLVAVAAGIAVSAMVGLERFGVTLVGHIPPGLPPFAVPDLAVAGALWPAALGIALMSFVESIAAGRAFVRSGEPMPTPNRELFALGLANVACSAFAAMPASASTSQTGVNRSAGARSQIAGVVMAGAVVATLLFLTSVVALLPQPALAAVVVATTATLFRPSEFAAIRRVRTMEFLWAVAAMVGVVLLGTLNGILLAVAISVLALFYLANRPPVYVVGRRRGGDTFEPIAAGDPEIETIPGLLILRTEGRVHFANAQRIGDQMWPLIEEIKPRVVVLELSAVPDLEYTALTALTEAERKLRDAGTTLWLVAMNPGVREVVERSPLGKVVGADRIYPALRHAVAAFNRQAAA